MQKGSVNRKECCDICSIVLKLVESPATLILPNVFFFSQLTDAYYSSIQCKRLTNISFHICIIHNASHYSNKKSCGKQIFRSWFFYGRKKASQGKWRALKYSQLKETKKKKKRIIILKIWSNIPKIPGKWIFWFLKCILFTVKCIHWCLKEVEEEGIRK